MASAKDTFEPNTFEPRTFAAGTFRGIGVTVDPGSFVCIKNSTLKPSVSMTSTIEGVRINCSTLKPAVRIQSDLNPC